MRIPQATLDAVFAHGTECYPEEACGLLSGPEEGDALSGFHPLENELGRLHARDPNRYPRGAREGYYLDPLAFLKLQQALEAEGHRVKVIYHTHPDVGAYFSEEDRHQAAWAEGALYPGMVYLVCGVKQGRPDGAILAVYNESTKEFDVNEVVSAGCGLLGAVDPKPRVSPSGR